MRLLAPAREVRRIPAFYRFDDVPGHAGNRREVGKRLAKGWRKDGATSREWAVALDTGMGFHWGMEQTKSTALALSRTQASGADSGARGLGRLLLQLAGWCALLLGMIGVILPLLPTAPFLVVALMCFARSDPRMLERMFRMPVIGRYLRDWQEGRGVSRSLKWTAILALWATALWTVLVLAKTVMWKTVVLVVAVLSTIHLLLMPVASSRRHFRHHFRDNSGHETRKS